MSKIITDNVRNENAISTLHLFEFEMYDVGGTIQEIIYFTDHDLFVEHDGNEYSPISITFDTLKEDTSLTADSINIQIDNINGEVSQIATSQEWRGNKATIKRIIFLPNTDIINGETYEFGYGDNLDLFPVFKTSDITFDEYILFEGIIDTFSATEQALTGTLTSQFVNWQRPDPSRTYSQNEFTTVISAMTEELTWGAQE